MLFTSSRHVRLRCDGLHPLVVPGRFETAWRCTGSDDRREVEAECKPFTPEQLDTRRHEFQFRHLPRPDVLVLVDGDTHD